MSRHSFFAFDTYCQMQLAVGDFSASDLDVLAMRVEESARVVESTLSMYDAKSELSQLSASYETGRWYKISALCHQFLLENRRMYEWTDGIFDPTVGKAVKLWDFLADSPTIPDAKAIESSLVKAGFGQVEIEKDEPKVRFHAPNLVIDPGASGKGFALQQAVNILKEAGITSGYLNYGGNLFVIGSKQEEDSISAPWRVGINNPHSQDVFEIVELVDEGISTSSWYEHGFTVDDKRYHHVLDPRTGYPAKLEISSVSIISDNAFYTDLVSTPYLILGPEKGEELLRKIRLAWDNQITLRSVVIPWPTT